MSKQSNTQAGALLLPSSASLADKEGYLLKVTTSGGVSKFAIAAAATDAAFYVCDDGGAASGDDVKGIPLSPDRNFRVLVKSSSSGGNAGDKLTLQTDGTVDTDPGSGSRNLIGIAEEAYVAGQLVLLRPLLQYLS